MLINSYGSCVFDSICYRLSGIAGIFIATGVAVESSFPLLSQWSKTNSYAGRINCFVADILYERHRSTSFLMVDNTDFPRGLGSGGFFIF